jgi:hypothetical protein
VQTVVSGKDMETGNGSHEPRADVQAMEESRNENI